MVLGQALTAAALYHQYQAVISQRQVVTILIEGQKELASANVILKAELTKQHDGQERLFEIAKLQGEIDDLMAKQRRGR